MTSIIRVAVSAALFSCACGGGTDGSGATAVSWTLTIHVNSAGRGSGHLYSPDPSFECWGECKQTFPAGTAVRLVAWPQTDSEFTGWTGACVGMITDCTVQMDGDKDLSAGFVSRVPVDDLVVNVQFTGNGGGRVTSTLGAIDCVKSGATVSGRCALSLHAGPGAPSFQVAPDAGSEFVGWGGACSGAGPCTIAIAGSYTLWVHLEPKAPPPDACLNIPPPNNVPMRQYVSGITAETCDDGAGDGNGNLAFLRHAAGPNTHVDSIEFVTSGGVALKSSAVDMGAVSFGQWGGISILADAPYLGPFANRVVQLTNFDATGNVTGTIYLWVGLEGHKPVAGAHSSGTILLAGDFAVADPTQPTVFGPMLHGAAMFSGAGQSGARMWGPIELDSAGTVFGAGVAPEGNSLVVTDGSARFGAGTISAQWFGVHGSPLTPEFVLLSGFTPGPATWFEVTPLTDFGVLVQRIDAVGNVLHARALVTVPSGSPEPQPAPAWMVARPDSRFQLTPFSSAYAVLPLRANGVACTQRLEIVSPAGVSCGVQEYKIADGVCDTHDLTLGIGGTVIQRLPDAMEQTTDFIWGTSCTWRWWTRAVR